MAETKSGWTKMVGVASGIVILITALGAVGISVPKLATKDEIFDLAASLQKTSDEIILLKLRLANDSLTQLRIAKSQLQGPPPAWMIKDEIKLMQEIENLRRELK